MDKTRKEKVDGSSQAPEKLPPRSLAIAEKGISTGKDFAKMMSSLMSDLIEGRVAPNVGNATCNAGGKLLRIVELEFKYGTRGPGAGTRTLSLTVDENTDGASAQLPEAQCEKCRTAVVGMAFCPNCGTKQRVA